VQFVFAFGAEYMTELPPLPDPTHPSPRAQAMDILTEHLRNLVKILCLASKKADGLYGTEFRQAAMTLWSHAVQTLRPSVADFIVATLAPYSVSLTQCLRVLRPDLGPEELFLMEASICGQVAHLHSHIPLTLLRRGAPYGDGDLESLVDHFVQFSFRGLGLPEASALQGTRP